MNEVQFYTQPVPGYNPILVSGQPLYEHLLKTDQKKLKRLMKEEQQRYAETHALDYEARYRKLIEEADTFYESVMQKSPDYQLLGLSNHPGHLFKKDVRNAYRRQARKLHPDAGGSDAAFKELYAAYRRVLASVPKE